MKMLICIIAMLVLVFTFAHFAFAGWTEQRIGNTDFYQSTDGQSGFGQQIGNNYFYSGSNGQTVNCQRVGTMTFCN